ncbi:MAG: acyl-ACP--UDP-N-acetylglucosamine O-acyltransferase [Desulfovibrio sp.]|nr:MAG: acyl-ACP--UDP-N-acetylglucosamine O-acyltransferase [Desulfovibrio sp.]
MTVEIHTTAIVDPKAQLGESVTVGPFTIIEAGAEVGDRTSIGSHCEIMASARIGTDNQIYSHVLIGGDPQHITFTSENGKVEIGDRNVVREYVTVHRGTDQGGGLTKVGSECMLMGYVHVAHDCILGNGVVFANAVMLAGHVQVGDYAMIGGITGVHQFSRIGEHAFLGATSGLNQDLPPFMLAGGYRATLHGLNVIGLRRRNFSKEAINALNSAYRIYWRSDLGRKEALAQIQEELGHVPEVHKLITFISESERGVCSAKEREGNVPD